jgi:hypothetical protein
MSEQIFQTEYAGHTVRYRFLVPATRLRFGPWLRRAEGGDADVSVTPERLELVRDLLGSGCTDEYAEFRTQTELSSHPLLKYGCCFFHAVSLCRQGRAFLLTAPSGTGKTTQFLNWQRLHPGEITMICGDMPVLEQRPDGRVWVHPSPWNGKESLGSRSHPPAPLAGIVLLEQGDDNTIALLPVRDAIPALFSQFIVQPDTEEEILALSGLMDQMLRTVPVWKLTNRGDDASTELLRQTLEGGRHGTV